MILLLDTSSGICKLSFVDGNTRFYAEWQADRELARGLHKFIHEQLNEHEWTWRDISGIGAFRGPGSFTGLRIGLTVANTLADSLQIPIVGTTGDDWQEEALSMLSGDHNNHIVMPEYGSDPHITKPRK